MEKYQCEDCGHIFEGDLSTMLCPNCGSANIKKVETDIPIKWKYVGIAVAVGGIICLIIALTGEDKLVASMQVKEGIVSIEVEGVTSTTLNKEYKVAVYDQSNKVHGTAFFKKKKKKVAQYPTMHLLEGQCYTFNVERKDGNAIKKLRWKTGHEYCVPTPPVKPEIDHIKSGTQDHENLVWNNVEIVMKKEGNFTYSIGDKQQSTNVFNNVRPGSYTVIVKNEEGVSTSQPLILKEIKKLPPALTLQEVQDIFDKISNGSMSAATAQDKLAEGNVNLTREVQPGNIKTLWGALMEAEMGEKFVVNSFENDPNTNKIKSGSLTISRR